MQARVIEDDPVAQALLEAADGLLVVLNEDRQIVAGNLHKHGAHRSEVEQTLGLRLGEALQCKLAVNNPSGCGASDACRTCGALQAMVESSKSNEPSQAECLLTIDRDGTTEPVEYRVRAHPVAIGGTEYVVVSLRDIRDEKRREALEQIFFHDVLNTVAGLSAWSERLQQLQPEPESDIGEASKRIATLVRRLEREVRDQRDLRLAEEGTLSPRMQTISANRILAEARELFSSQRLTRSRTLTVESASVPVELTTDPSLLLRVITNMVKNALEATPQGGTVRLSFETGGTPQDGCAFHVWNEGFIPKVIASRIFQRSFTTHPEPGRGLGTYSMALLGERYLGGKVAFTTDAERGTVFTIRLPATRPT